MGIELAIGAGISALGAATAAEGNRASASAAGNAARAQQSEAQRQYANLQNITDRATVSGIAAADKSIAAQDKNISRQEQLISQLDPTIIEASQQALRLLKGESASTLGPLKQQRDQARQKLVNSLREQLGPGAETSTAGIQALTRFDAETSNLFAGAQQAALSNLGNISSQFTSQRPDMLRELQGQHNFGQTQSSLLFNQANVLSGAGNNLINTAGANYVEGTLAGKGQAQLGGQIGQLGGLIMGQGLSGGGGFGSLFGGGGSSAIGPQAGGSYLNTGNIA
jgi:hypothetical protein